MQDENLQREGVLGLFTHWGYSGADLVEPERPFRKIADDMQNVVISRAQALTGQQLSALKLFPPLRGMTDDAVRAALAEGEVVLPANFSVYAAISGEGLRQARLSVALRPISEEEKVAVCRAFGAAA